jgi:phosphopantetheine adenylyltransferase
MTSSQYQFVSSTLIKEVAMLGGCLEGMVPDQVAVALKEKSSILAEVAPNIDKMQKIKP